MIETEFELISLEDDWQAATCDAVAAQIRDAGIKIKRTTLPGATFWNDWTKYPVLGHRVEHAPAGRADLLAGLQVGRGLERDGPEQRRS
jgi:peptide/nickel transport system substrate-binding protein